MYDHEFGDPIKFDAVYELNSTKGTYTREYCTKPMNGSFNSEVKLHMEGADITVGAINFGGQEIYVPFDAISRRP